MQHFAYFSWKKYVFHAISERKKIFYLIKLWLHCSGKYSTSLQTFEQLMSEAYEEIDRFVEESEWLNEINGFCRDWGPEAKSQLKDAPIFDMDVCLHLYCKKNVVFLLAKMQEFVFGE